MLANKMTVFALAGALAVSAGCASKKYVREQVQGGVDPLDQRVGEVEQETANNEKRVEDLEGRLGREVSRVEEKAEGADERAGAAGNRADEAYQLAENSWEKANEKPKPFQYGTLTSETVYFGFDSRELTPEAKGALDGMMAQVQGYQDYRVEVRGFTDSTGGDRYNIELSQDRAEAVVRYLTVNHNVPLSQTQILGYGSELPVAENTTLEGRASPTGAWNSESWSIRSKSQAQWS